MLSLSQITNPLPDTMLSSSASAILLALVGVSVAQMTFSDGWGQMKRSAAGMNKRMPSVHPINLRQEPMQEQEGKDSIGQRKELGLRSK